MGDDGGVDTPGPPPCVPGVFDVCALAAPTESLSITGLLTINTDQDPRCVAAAQADGPEVCLLYFSDVTITAGGLLTVRGTRPLALVAKEALTIAGALDASSRAMGGSRGAGSAPAGLCSFAGNATNDSGGAGGGAGGTLASKGGGGGAGKDGVAGGQAVEPPAMWTVLRGGCDGQSGGIGQGQAGGAGGLGGGAVYLAAATLQISGAVLVGGSGGAGGGRDDGGGGGGSGGTIVLQSDALTVTGRLLAPGGGGGGGGDNLGGGVAGSDGTSNEGAAGGSGNFDAGDGGMGAATAAAASGAPCANNDDGGGGGGGGAGFVVLIGTSIDTTGAIIVPAAVRRAQ